MKNGLATCGFSPELIPEGAEEGIAGAGKELWGKRKELLERRKELCGRRGRDCWSVEEIAGLTGYRGSIEGGGDDGEVFGCAGFECGVWE